MQPPFEMVTESDIEKFRHDTWDTKEPETITWLDSFADGDMFFDVGANIGIYTLYCAAVHPKCVIHAFEPDIRNYEHLKANVALNLFSSVYTHQIAILDHAARDTFYAATGEVGCTGGQAEHILSEAFVHYPIRIVSIDRLVEGLGCPQHVKIDIDGQELRVVRGMAETLKNPSLQSVLIEVDLTTGEREEIVSQFIAAGFTMENRFNTMTPHSRERRAKEKIKVENVIFTRQ